MSQTPRFPRPGGRAGAALLALLTFAMLLAPGLRPTSADQLSDKQNQRSQLNGTMDQLRHDIQQTKDEEQQLQDEITGLNSQIATTEQDIAAAQTKLDGISADLASAQSKLAETRRHLAVDKAELAQALVFIYEQGQTSTLNQVLGSATFNEFWQKLIDLRRLAGSQQSALRRVKAEEADVTSLVTQIGQQQVVQKQTLAQLRTQSGQLQIELGARQAAEDHLAYVQQRDQQQLALAEKSAAELDAEIAAIKEAMAEAALRGGGNGHFVWPEQGPITQPFGCTPYPFEPWDPNCPSHHFHTGIDIGAAWGTPVGAGDAGIAYTYFSSYGYGNHVIIVHGNGWVSIYGHLASFAVGNGQSVGRGQTIGYEGSTGNSTGPHLHFEVRLNDTPQNPLQYLP